MSGHCATMLHVVRLVSGSMLACQCLLLTHFGSLACPYLLPTHLGFLACPYLLPTPSEFLACPYLLPIYLGFLACPYLLPVYLGFLACWCLLPIYPTNPAILYVRYSANHALIDHLCSTAWTCKGAHDHTSNSLSKQKGTIKSSLHACTQQYCD